MYSLYAPMWRTNDTLKNLLKEVLGYSDDEISVLEFEHYGRNIVNNLTIEQAKKISEIFLDNDFQIYLNDGSGLDNVFYWNQLGISLQDNPPKEHYCDEPLVSREHLANLNIPKKVDSPITELLFQPRNVPKCSTCGSTDIKKISTVNRMVSTGLFGLASSKIGKTHKCNNCGTTW